MKKMTTSQRIVLIVAIVTSFLAPFLISSINVALPNIESDLGLNSVELGWVVTSFLLSSAIFLLIIGSWADSIGYKKMFKWGALLFVIFAFICAFSLSGVMLISMRFLQGIGASMLMAIGPAILVREFPLKRRGEVLGLSVSAVYIGLTLRPAGGGLITNLWGWQSLFIVSGIFGVMVLYLAVKYLGNDQQDELHSILDFKGALIYAIALGLSVYGSSVIDNITGRIFLISGILLFLLFFRHQAKSHAPIFPISVFRTNRLFAYSNLAALINYSSTFAIAFMISLYLQKVLHYSHGKAGGILIAQPLIMAIVSPIAGKLSDRIDLRWLASLGMLICCIGFGFGLFSSPNMNTIMSSIDKSKAGMASGISATMRVVGHIISISIASAIFALFFRQEPISVIETNVFMKAVNVLFLVFSIICLTGVYLSFSEGKLR